MTKISKSHHVTKTGVIKKNPDNRRKILIDDATGYWENERDFDRQWDFMAKAQDLGLTKNQYVDLIEDRNHWSLAE